MQEKKPSPGEKALISELEKKLALKIRAQAIGYFCFAYSRAFPYNLLLSLFFVILLKKIYDNDQKRAEVKIRTFMFREAAQKNNTKVMNKLFEDLGPDLFNTRGTNSKRTALHFAVSAGQIDAVKYLRGRHCDVNIQDVKGNTPLHDALLSLINGSHCDTRIIRELIFKYTYNQEYKEAVRANLARIKSMPDQQKYDCISEINAAREKSIQGKVLNTNIDIELKNNDGKTILDLFYDWERAGGQKVSGFNEIKDAIEELYGVVHHQNAIPSTSKFTP